MTFKSYTKQFIIILITCILLTVSFNIYINEFGLFGNKKNRNIRVHTDEKTTKYLLSFNYIPNNFNGILVGPSLSDQMIDTKKISNSTYNIYNLSMNSANVTELKFAIDNVIENGNMKLFLICLDPYITKNSGIKSSQINPKEYYATLGSIFTIKYYIRKYLDIKKGNKSVFYDSYWGYSNNEYDKIDENSTLNINKTLNKLDNNEYDINKLVIDKMAYSELSSILNEIRNDNIQILAYYHPTPKRIFEHPLYKQHYNIYRKKIDRLLTENDIIIDFTQNKYDYIRSNDDSYSDGAHLSKNGANKVLKILKSSINSINEQ